MKSLVGETIAKQYEVLDALGHGATSVVYKARDLEGDEVVALKVLHQYLVQKADTFKRFEQEAQLASLLEHPNIARVRKHIFEDGQPPILVLDYVEGETLAALLQRETNLSLPRAWKLFIQIADAMEHAHQKGVVHRNLKPGNIIISKNDEGKEVAHITDFGMAKLLPSSGQEIQELTQKGAVIGSPLYMSPEQCLGRTIDGRADIYSLGCLMYAVLLGRPPLKGDHIIDTMAKHVGEIPMSFNEACPQLNLPIQVQQIVFKCMAKQPDDRYESMDALKLDLLRMQQGKKPRASSSVLTVGAPPPPAPAKQGVELPDPIRSQWALGVLLSVLVLSLGFIGWVKKSKTIDAVELAKEERKDDSLSRRISGLSPLALLRQADELRMLKREQEAALVYKQAISRAAELAEKDAQNREILCIAHQGLAEAYRRVGKFKDARKEFEMALNIQSLDPNTDYLSRNRIQIEVAGCMMHEGQIAEASSLLTGILKESKDRVTRSLAQLMFADVFLAQGKFADADARLNLAQDELFSVDAVGELMVVLMRHVDLLLAQEKFKQAEDVLKLATAKVESAHRMKEESFANLVMFCACELARVYCLQSKYDQAAEVLTASSKHAALANRPRRMATTDALAATYFLSKDFKKASAALDGVDESSINGRLGHTATIIRMFVESKQYGKAYKMIDELKSKEDLSNQERAELYSLRAFSQLKEGKFDNAMKSVDKALELLEDSPIDEFRQHCWMIKARILKAMGRADAADVIKKDGQLLNDGSNPYDELVPLYHQRIQIW